MVNTVSTTYKAIVTASSPLCSGQCAYRFHATIQFSASTQLEGLKDITSLLKLSSSENPALIKASIVLSTSNKCNIGLEGMLFRAAVS